ncbi:MAG: polysaccharide deacetylase family protein [Cyclobacteriaceae bacterium]
MRYILFSLTLAIFFASVAQPTLSFTFDDGSTSSRGKYSLEEWNTMILNSLDNANVKAVFFVTTNNKSSKSGQYLINSWNDMGHKIANHTYSHPNFNSKKNSAEKFKEELLKADEFIRDFSNYTKLFRFPYLKEGYNDSKADSIRQILKDEGYKNGYVTIDASDWYIDSRLRGRLKENPNANLEAYKKFYLEHLFERANYYETLSYKITNRHINHTLLLHHNLAAALFLDDLIDMFKSKGWNVISADDAFKDSIYDEIPKHAGEGLIWALAKELDQFEGQLRYPAEDGKYERKRMDELGL